MPSRLPAMVLESLRSAAVVVDGSDAVVLANGAAQTMGIVRRDRLVVKELRWLVRAVRRAGSLREAEVQLPPHGLGRPAIAASARLVPVGGGDVIVLVDDMSEARRVDAVRRDFVANVSHELKTPVSAMSLLAEAIGQARADPDAVGRFADQMLREATRLSRLIQELIDLSRLQGAEPAPTYHPVDVDTVLSEAIDRARLPATKKHISLTRAEPSALTVLGDEVQLVTVLANLLDNAIAYSSEGGRVSAGLRRDGETVEISVTDQGVGICEADLDRIFERFYRVDPARSRETGGTGLGLAIVKHIVSNHHGDVSVWSALGRGSTFTVRLPLVDRQASIAGAAQ